MLQTYR